MIAVPNTINCETISTTYYGEPIGEYKCTFYCSCSICCGEYSQYGGLTASGKYAQEGRTVASDLPLGTRIYIEGLGEYIVEDRGGAVHGNVLDIYLSSHDACLKRGVEYRNVYIIEE